MRVGWGQLSSQNSRPPTLCYATPPDNQTGEANEITNSTMSPEEKAAAFAQFQRFEEVLAVPGSGIVTPATPETPAQTGSTDSSLQEGRVPDDSTSPKGDYLSSITKDNSGTSAINTQETLATPDSTMQDMGYQANAKGDSGAVNTKKSSKQLLGGTT